MAIRINLERRAVSASADSHVAEFHPYSAKCIPPGNKVKIHLEAVKSFSHIQMALMTVWSVKKGLSGSQIYIFKPKSLDTWTYYTGGGWGLIMNMNNWTGEISQASSLPFIRTRQPSSFSGTFCFQSCFVCLNTNVPVVWTAAQYAGILFLRCLSSSQSMF